jgi:D-alanyl-D-alanine carboxypeptidase/D-alanyl-D-alanine-endopeptidase (penicillin-binding protein 4)
LHLAFLITTSACAKSPPAVPAAPALDPVHVLRNDLTAATNLPGVQQGAWGIVVQSLDRDERLFELNPRTLLVPASSAKMVSVASAVDAVGWDYQFQTTLQTSGTISDGVLHGDLIVVGSGDPSIAGRGGNDVNGWIDALKAQGIRRIEGRIIGDDDAVEEPRPSVRVAVGRSWLPDGCVVRRAELCGEPHVRHRRAGRHAAAPTTIGTERYAAAIPLANRSVTGATGSMQLLWPEQRPANLSHHRRLDSRRRASGDAGDFRGQSHVLVRRMFRQRLIRAGIEVNDDAWDVDDVMPKPDRSSARTLFTYRSPPLSDIAVPTLKDSINLYGEAFLRLNAAAGAFPTNDAALDGLRQRLSTWGVPAGGQQLVDGSGLSRRDVITPEALLIVLRHMYDATGGSPWMRRCRWRASTERSTIA